jgi:hypothetical protein
MARRARDVTTRLALAVGGAALLLTACAAEPFDYTPADEIPPGPGLLSGEDGEFVIYRR